MLLQPTTLLTDSLRGGSCVRRPRPLQRKCARCAASSLRPVQTTERTATVAAPEPHRPLVRRWDPEVAGLIGVLSLAALHSLLSGGLSPRPAEAKGGGVYPLLDRFRSSLSADEERRRARVAELEAELAELQAQPDVGGPRLGLWGRCASVLTAGCAICFPNALPLTHCRS